MDPARIPTDGPETTLGQVVRRLGLRYSRTFVARAVASHKQPTSLLALVEVARTLGLDVTAGRAEESALAGFEAPVVVHFTGVEGGGFGILEGTTAHGFRVWDSVHGLQTIDRNTFLAHWSGIVASFSRTGTRGPREPRYLRNRVTEIAFSGYDPPAPVGSRAAPVVRFGFGMLLTGTLVASLSRVASPDRAAATVLTLLTLAGLGMTILTAVSIGAQGSLSERICARGRFVDCQSVLSSRYSRIFGIPLADLGIAFFGSILLLLATGASGAQGIWAAAGWLYAASIPVSLVLIGAQVAMRQLCTLCLAVHAVNLSAVVVSWLWLDPSWAMRDLFGSFLLITVIGALLLFLAVPYFRKHQGMRVLVGRQRRLAGSPFASLAELLTEDKTDLVADACAVRSNETSATHEVTVFVHPSCGKCEPVLQQVWALAQSGTVRVYVGVAPKDPEESDRRMCAAIIATGLAAGPQMLLAAYATVKQQLRTMLGGDPVGPLASTLGLARADLERHLPEARERVERSEAFVDEHAEGTPAVFFDSRLFRGELGHLVFLLQHHPELLQEVGDPSEVTR